MSLDLPRVDSDRAATSAHALSQAMLGVEVAREQLETAMATAPDMPPDAAVAWHRALRARLSDLTQMHDVLEHARNVIGKVGRELPRYRTRYDAASGEAANSVVLEAIGLLALSAEQFTKLAGPLDFAAVPDAPPVARTATGAVQPLGDDHGLPDGLVLIKGRDY